MKYREKKEEKIHIFLALENILKNEENPQFSV